MTQAKSYKWCCIVFVDYELLHSFYNMRWSLVELAALLLLSQSRQCRWGKAPVLHILTAFYCAECSYRLMILVSVFLFPALDLSMQHLIAHYHHSDDATQGHRSTSELLRDMLHASFSMCVGLAHSTWLGNLIQDQLARGPGEMKASMLRDNNQPFVMKPGDRVGGGSCANITFTQCSLSNADLSLEQLKTVLFIAWVVTVVV